MLAKFTPEQQRRYEFYRRSHFDYSKQGKVAQIMNEVSRSSAPEGQQQEEQQQSALITMAGLTKLFVGEVIEGARAIMEEAGEKGPIHPRHIREAYQRMQQKGDLLYLKPGANAPAKQL